MTGEAVAGWDGREIGLHSRMQALTLEIILRAVFGLDPGPRLDALRESVGMLLAYSEKPISLVPGPRDPERAERQERLLNRAGPLKGFVDVRERIDELILEQISERRAEADSDRDDVLAMLLEARHEDGSEMSDQELRDELMTLLVAGHETTASSLAWAFERISREPAVLARLTDEVRSGDEEEYLLATIREVLRRRPVLPNTAPRLVKQPVTVGGWDYPTGCCLVGCAYLLHHDPEIYPEPYAFRPERFLEQKPGTYTWIPFGGGPPALPRNELRDAGDADRDPRDAPRVRAGARRRRPRAAEPPQHHRHARSGRAGAARDGRAPALPSRHEARRLANRVRTPLSPGLEAPGNPRLDLRTRSASAVVFVAIGFLLAGLLQTRTSATSWAEDNWPIVIGAFAVFGVVLTARAQAAPAGRVALAPRGTRARPSASSG